MKLALIVAMARNRVIGRDNAMPWQQPDDLRYFKRMTLGKPVIMGRKTFASIGRPLPGRSNIVVTRNTSFAAEGIHVVHSLDAAIALGQRLLAELGPEDGELMLVGGAELYAQGLPLASRLYLTELHGEPEGDARFPAIDPAAWRELSREDHDAGEANTYAYSFVVLERRREGE
jgi:dihydrofolate reductase